MTGSLGGSEVDQSDDYFDVNYQPEHIIRIFS